MKTKRQNSKQYHENIIIESQRIRKAHQDHIADQGHVSMSHCNMVSKPIPTPQAVTIPEAEAGLDKGMDKFAEATDLGRVSSDQ